MNPSLFFYSHSGLSEALSQERMKTNLDADKIEVLEETLHFIKEQHGDNIDEFDSLIRQGSITYDLLWALFPPNELTYQFFTLTEQDQILRARHHSYEETQQGSFFLIVCDIITNDGE